MRIPREPSKGLGDSSLPFFDGSAHDCGCTWTQQSVMPLVPAVGQKERAKAIRAGATAQAEKGHTVQGKTRRNGGLTSGVCVLFSSCSCSACLSSRRSFPLAPMASAMAAVAFPLLTAAAAVVPSSPCHDAREPLHRHALESIFSLLAFGTCVRYCR
jgi:hypothetical protein